jgi:hypothetical protein
VVVSNTGVSSATVMVVACCGLITT